MKTTLPIGREHSALRHLVILFTKTFQTLLLASGLLIVFSVQASAQSEPEYLKFWTALEEAEFYFDTMFAVVKCDENASPQILLNAFNEAGNVSEIGFTLELTDANGNSATVEVPKFAIGQAEMQIASCESDENAHLRLPLPDGIDGATVEIEITYNK